MRTHDNLSSLFRVGVAGYGGAGSRNFSFPQYTVALDGWVCPNLPEIWEDFAGDETGIICAVWDPSRLGWFSRPELSEELAKHPELGKFLAKPPFQRWIYAPVDASGPNSRLTFPLAQNLLGFDRVLAYGKFGEDVIRRTLGDQESENRGLAGIPHGINSDVFYPRIRKTSRAFFFSLTKAITLRGDSNPIENDEALIGCVCTNQSRKDLGLLMEAVAILSRRRKVRLWLHTDVLERSWSIPALLVDFGLLDHTVISLGHLPDSALAQAYSACDITIAPGAEGFGYPIAESLACGTPVVTGNYAGGAELVPSDMCVTPVGFRYESLWACQRPVYQAESWALMAEEWIDKRSSLDSRYDWKNNWPIFEEWFRKGIA